MKPLHEALLDFARVTIGTSIRGQKVAGVNIDLDTISQPVHPLRYILMVCFHENPVPDDATPEYALLARVFSEVPKHARIVTHDVNELLAILTGERKCLDSEWLLEDERAAQ